MTAALILWGHALAALLFAGAAGVAWRRSRTGRWMLVAALLITALWALATAGIDPRDLITRLAKAARDLAWLGFVYTLVKRGRAGQWAFATLCFVIATVVVLGAGFAMAETAARGREPLAALATGRQVFGMMAAAGALILVHHLHAAATAAEQRGVRLTAVALAAMWTADLLVSSAAYGGAWVPGLAAVRGFVMAGVALLLAAGTDRRDSGALALSRPAAMRALGAMALLIYIGLAAALARFAGTWGGDHARALQAGVIVGAATAMLTLISTSWLGAWAKVKLAKHLFRHRYDYRTEWQRFTDTLSGAGASLEERVVQAVAQLLDASGGVLLSTDSPGVGWHWDAAVAPLAAAAVDYLGTTRRVIELDALRAGVSPADAAAVAEDVRMLDAAWLLVPLMHGDTLAGAVLLARPPLSRALDWEDFDLLRVAGRQAASCLVEDRAGRALAEARRFDEFNRRFAFILHDIKNLVSQQQLVARNAERHAGNPAFRADMVATLKDSADRMTALLARLSHREPASEPLGPVDCAALVARVARGRRAHQPIAVEAERTTWAIAHPNRLEQVLGHLLQNAVEASAPDATVRMRVSQASDRVTIAVIDHGTGMAAAFVRDELFRPFASTKPGGFGIGAFEARQLVIGMGGTLDVDSREGAGTCFRIELPLAAALEQAA